MIYSREPTKMDNDVLKALHDVDIDKNVFPNVYQWYNALMKYSLEERARYVWNVSFFSLHFTLCNCCFSFISLFHSFPQPISSNGSFVKSPSPLRSPGNALNRLSIKSILPKVGQFQLKPSKFTPKQ